MQKILKIAQREYIETVKTKTFFIGILVTPIIMVGIIFFANRISGSTGGARPSVKVAVTDLSARLSSEIEDGFHKHNDSHPQRQILFQSLKTKGSSTAVEERAKAKLRSGQLDAYVVLDEDIVAGSGKVHFYTHKPTPAKLDALWPVEKIINSVVIEQ